MFKFFLFQILMMSIFWGLSSLTWFSFWVALEMNMLAFMGVLSLSKSSHFRPIGMIYFLPQTAGSALFVFVISIASTSSYGMSILVNSGLLTALSLKSGLAPFHHWFINLSMKSSNFIFFFLSTLQKLLPIFFLQAMSFWWLNSFILLNLAISLASVSCRKLILILSFSSLFSLSWVLGAMNFTSSLLYFSVYSVSLGLFLLNLSNSQNVLSKPHHVSKIQVNLLFFSGLALAGVPPFLGFFVKIYLIKGMFFISNITSIILIMASVFWLYVYLSVSLSITSKFHHNSVFSNTPSLGVSMFIFLVLSLGGFMM